MVYPSGQKSLFILKLITKQKCETFPFLKEKVDRILPLFGIIPNSNYISVNCRSQKMQSKKKNRIKEIWWAGQNKEKLTGTIIGISYNI